jgi:hypothetical protein
VKKYIVPSASQPLKWSKISMNRRRGKAENKDRIEKEKERVCFI